MSKKENKSFLKKKRNREPLSEEIVKYVDKKKGKSYDNKISVKYKSNNKVNENDQVKSSMHKISEENKKYKDKYNLLEQYQKNIKNKLNLKYIIHYVKAISSTEYNNNWPKLLNYYFIKISNENFINEETEKSLIHFKEIISCIKYNYIIYEIELENNIVEYVHYLHIKFKTPTNISATKFSDFSILLSKDIEDVNLILYGFYGGHKTVLRIYTYINRNKNTCLPMIKKEIEGINSIIKEYNDVYQLDIKLLDKGNINILNIDDLLPEDKFTSDDIFN